MKTVLSIAGSDCSGGAGIQADIKTITMHGVYAMTAITALTAQNTMGVYDVQESTPDFLKKQIGAVFEDIYPDAVKIGMVSSAELIMVIAQSLSFFRAKNIVTDPVMISTSGHSLLADDAEKALCDMLLPMSDLITPNIPEGERLSGMDIHSEEAMEAAAAIMGQRFRTDILLKGGHSTARSKDVLYSYSDKSIRWFVSEPVDNENSHGTGCTLSSAIAANLAKGCSLEDAVQNAKKYLTDALSAGLDLGLGKGPLNHSFCLCAE